MERGQLDRSREAFCGSIAVGESATPAQPPQSRAHLILPALPAPAGAWAPTASPIARRVVLSQDSNADESWELAGRRMQVRGSVVHGVEQVTDRRHVLLTGLEIRVGGAALAAVGACIAPDQVVRQLSAAGHEISEGSFTALDLPVFILDIAAPLAVEVTIQFTIPGHALRGDTPAPGRPADAADLYHRAGGDLIALRLGEGRFDEIISGGDGVEVCVSGRGGLRLMLASARDDADLERTAALLARRTFTGLQSQRAQHARLLRDYGASFETPEPPVGFAVEWAKVNGDAALVEVGAGRMALDHPDADPDRMAVLASALLAAGLREGPRALLATVAGSSDPDAVRSMAAAWLAWTGGTAALGRPAPMDDACNEGARAVPRLSSHAAIDILRATAGCTSADPVAVLGAVVAIWGIEPDAPNGAVGLTPRLPAAWPSMAIRRLRVGRTALDCELRRRPGCIVARVIRVSGPPVVVTLRLAEVNPTGVSVDDVALGRDRARFTADGLHEVTFHLPE